ncbi:MAG: 50S ribosomal protein L4 [Candidatus Woesearchaeota archaeon]
MKIPIIDLQNQKTGEKVLPAQFNEAYRPDLIERAVHALQSRSRQPYGAHPEAGKRHSAKLSRRRRDYKGAYGMGISRVPRKTLNRRGTRFYWVGAVAPNTTGGRRSHPPKAEKIWEQMINKKENRKAIRSALAASLDKQIVSQRGHKVPDTYPFIISADVEKLAKTGEISDLLKRLNLAEELSRSLIKKIRSGIGKLRGRKYQKKKGLLIVVGNECPLLKSAMNIPGVDVVQANQLNAELLAPGKMPGRISLFTENAIKEIEEKKLFV